MSIRERKTMETHFGDYTNHSGTCDNRKIMISSVSMLIAVENSSCPSETHWTSEVVSIRERKTMETHFGDYTNHSCTCDNRKIMISSVSMWIEVETLVMPE